MSAPELPPLAGWAPSPPALAAVVRMLGLGRSGGTADQRAAYELLEANKTSPEFIQTLVYTLAVGMGLDKATRSSAAATVKWVLTGTYATLPPASQSFLQAALTATLADAEPDVRRMAANVVSTIVRNVGLDAWPALPRALAIGLATPAALRGSLTCLSQLAEDVAAQFDEAELGHPLNDIVPALIQLMTHAELEVRLQAAECMRNFQLTGGTALTINTNAYQTALATLTLDPAPSMRKVVSFSWGTLLESDATSMWPAMPNVLSFQLSCLADADNAVALAGCDFWCVLAETMAHYRDDPSIVDVVDPCLPALVRTLMERMTLTEEDTEGAQIEDVADASVADREQDIAPAASTRSRVEGEHARAGAGAGEEDDEASAGEEEEEDMADGDPFGRSNGKWTVRRAAGGALEAIAMVYRNKVLDVAVPDIVARLGKAHDPSADWRVFEVGLLALGSLAYGCADLLSPHLPTLYPFLVGITSDARPCVRSSAIFTLSKYSSWMVEMDDVSAPDPATYLPPYVAMLTARMMDHTKSVQMAALAATVDLCNTASDVLEPYVSTLLTTFYSAFGMYQLKNRLLLYDCFAAVAEQLPEAVAAPEHAPQLVTAFAAHFARVPDKSLETTVLCGTLSALVSALGLQFGEHLVPLYSRACRLIEEEIVAEAVSTDAGRCQAAGIAVDRVCNCLDLIDSIVTVAGGSMAATLQASSLLDKLPFLVSHSSASVRQSVFSLIGSVARACHEVLRPYLPVVMPYLTACIRVSPDNMLACNNAMWASGHLVASFMTDLSEFVPRVLPALSDVLHKRNIPDSLQENVAIALSQFGNVFPAVVASALKSRKFLSRWTKRLALVTHGEEQYAAYAGYMRVLATNPADVIPQMANVVILFLSYPNPPADIVAMMRHVFSAVRAASSPAQVTEQLSLLAPEQQAAAAKLLL